MHKTEHGNLDKLILFEQNNDNLRRARAPLHIMVIDDDPVTCRLIQKMFSDNYHVTTCETIQQGLNEYLVVLPDLLFLDVQLGDDNFNGLDVLKTIIKRDSKANIVIITSEGTKNNIDDAWQFGASGFLTKPFSSEKLLEQVRNCNSKKSGALWN